MSMELPPTLTEQLARGNGVLLLGPPSHLTGLTQALAAECAYPATKSDRSWPAVARYYQAMTDRQRLVIRLHDWLEEQGDTLAPLVRAVARYTIDQPPPRRSAWRWNRSWLSKAVAPPPPAWTYGRQRERVDQQPVNDLKK